jgi:hypothetical protein
VALLRFHRLVERMHFSLLGHGMQSFEENFTLRRTLLHHAANLAINSPAYAYHRPALPSFW